MCLTKIAVEQSYSWFQKRVIPEKICAELLSNELIINGTGGGLVIGNPHTIIGTVGSGIKIVQQNPLNSKQWVIVAEIEGGEFLLNRKTSMRFPHTSRVINSTLHLCKEMVLEFNPTEEFTFFDCQYEVESKFLAIEGGQAIINKYSTIKYFDRLVRHNAR